MFKYKFSQKQSFLPLPTLSPSFKGFNFPWRFHYISSGNLFYSSLPLHHLLSLPFLLQDGYAVFPLKRPQLHPVVHSLHHVIGAHLLPVLPANKMPEIEGLH